MGVTIGNCKKEISMGYLGFFRLRSKIADLLDEEFGAEYRKLIDPRAKIDNEKMNRIINEKMLDEDVIDFLYQYDCGGKMTPGQCRSLYEIIKDYDDDYLYGYERQVVKPTFSNFKNIVYDCYKNRRTLYWG